MGESQPLNQTLTSQPQILEFSREKERENFENHPFSFQQPALLFVRLIKEYYRTKRSKHERVVKYMYMCITKQPAKNQKLPLFFLPPAPESL